jgi:hypothetical protein
MDGCDARSARLLSNSHKRGLETVRPYEFQTRCEMVPTLAVLDANTTTLVAYAIAKI